MKCKIKTIYNINRIVFINIYSELIGWFVIANIWFFNFRQSLNYSLRYMIIFLKNFSRRRVALWLYVKTRCQVVRNLFSQSPLRWLPFLSVGIAKVEIFFESANFIWK